MNYNVIAQRRLTYAFDCGLTTLTCFLSFSVLVECDDEARSSDE